MNSHFIKISSLVTSITLLLLISSFMRPLFLIGDLWAEFAVKEIKDQPFGILHLIVAYQNGFFWQAILDSKQKQRIKP